MSNYINRRQLLKTGALLTGSLGFIPSFANKLLVHPPAQVFDPLQTWETDESVILSAPPEIKARLSANENPFGPSAKARKAIQDAIADSYRYPFTVGRELATKIATYEGVQPMQIMLGAGSSPLLLAAAMYFSKEGGSIITGDPSYHDLAEKAAQFKANIIKVPLTVDYTLDLDAMEKAITADTKLIYICNPNNPTATVLDTARLKGFCERVSPKVPIFIDEAYIDYLDDPKGASMMDAVRQGQNVIIARTFSKLYGFAGLRVGYAVAPTAIILALNQYSTGGMSISATSIQAANATYLDMEYLNEAKAKTVASKKFLYELLEKEGYTWIPSSANFVMFPIKMEAGKFSNEMMKRGVSIRTWRFVGKDWCRISLGTMDEMQEFAKAFKEIS
ncbi:histidinol-phosphate aminotransferase family protein [Paraflavitalea soli]|uniref:Histidinol-phosphate aminotransferase family protein n=1 Tax=Paraflavitalea soli TaxID=2315862 RepID=A0A3B7MJW1_9BACT|nr:histidinol-phosphate transaminase [Paraflavitalea soli]AXY74744.1 histidinol-phosphate aminotransferase family protein [Paraflavitalea soli]